MSLLRNFVIVISGSLISVGAIVLGLLVVAMVWWETPELHVNTDRAHAVVHMELLGEYPSDMRSVEISDDMHSTPIWRIVAPGQMFQLQSIPLYTGNNPANIAPDWGASRQEVPAAAASFQLDAGRSYRVTVCPSSVLGLCRSASFRLQPR